MSRHWASHGRPSTRKLCPSLTQTLTSSCANSASCFSSDRTRAFAEARRVLRSGGTDLFNVWDDLGHSDAGRIVHEAVAAEFKADAPTFLGRVPYAGIDITAIERDLRLAGFYSVTVEPVEKRTGPAPARDAAVGFCQRLTAAKRDRGARAGSVARITKRSVERDGPFIRRARDRSGSAGVRLAAR